MSILDLYNQNKKEHERLKSEYELSIDRKKETDDFKPTDFGYEANYAGDRSDAVFEAAVDENTVAMGIQKSVDYFSTKPKKDPNFNPKDYPKAYQLVGTDFRDELDDATSREEFNQLIKKYSKRTKDIEYLDSLGFEGVGYRVMSAILDPTNYLSAGLGYVTKLARATKYANALGGFAARAVLGGVTEGAVEGARMAMSDTTRDEFNLLLATGVGGAMGAVSHTASDVGNVLKKAAQGTVERTARANNYNKVINTMNKQGVDVSVLKTKLDTLYKKEGVKVGKSKTIDMKVAKALNEEANLNLNLEDETTVKALRDVVNTKTDIPINLEDNVVKQTDKIDKLKYGKAYDESQSPNHFIDKLQLDAYSMLKRANGQSETLDRFRNEMLHSVTDRSQSIKGSEIKGEVIDKIDSNFNETYGPLFQEYLAEVKGSGGITNNAVFNRYKVKDQKEFFEAFGKVHYDIPTNLSDNLVSKMKKANAKMSMDAHDVLSRAGHKDFAEGIIKKDGNYLPRQWDTTKLQDDLAKKIVKKSTIKEALFKSFKRNYGDVADLPENFDDVLKKTADIFVENLSKTQPKASSGGILESLKVNKMSDDIMEIVREQLPDLDDKAFAKLEKSLLKKNMKADTISSSTAKRNKVDTGTSFLARDGTEMNMSRYVNTNVQSLWKRYAVSMGGETALKGFGVHSRTDAFKILEKVKKDLKIDTLDETVNETNVRAFNNFEAILADFMTINTKSNIDGKMWKSIRIVNNLVRSSKLGGVWYSMAAEMGRVTHEVGITNFIKAIPTLKHLVANPFSETANKLVQEVKLFEALGTSMKGLPNTAKYEDAFTLGTKKKHWSNTLETFTEMVSDMVYQVGGVTTGTNILEHVLAVGTRTKVSKIAAKAKLSKKDIFYLKNNINLTEDQIEPFIKNIRKHEDKDIKGLFHFKNWDDQSLVNSFSRGVRRLSNNAIQRIDKHDQLGLMSNSGGKLVNDTPLGAFVMNLRSYVFAAHRKQFSNGVVNLTRGGEARSNTLKEWSYVTAFSALGYIAKTHVNYLQDGDKKKFREALEPKRIASSTFNMTTFGGLLPTVLNTGVGIATGKDLSGYSARGNADDLFGASMGYVQDGAKSLMVLGKAIDPTRSPTKSDIKKVFSMLPFSNIMGARGLINTISDIQKEKK